MVYLAEPDKRDMEKNTVRRLLLAKLAMHNAKYFFPQWSTKELRAVLSPCETVALYKGERGRPTENYSTIKEDVRLKIIRSFYNGKDLIEIAAICDEPINNVFYFFTQEHTEKNFGVSRCRHCKRQFIYLDAQTSLCPECNPNLTKQRKDVLVPLAVIEETLKFDFQREKANPRAFERKWYVAMKELLIERTTVDVHFEAEKNSRQVLLSEARKKGITFNDCMKYIQDIQNDLDAFYKSMDAADSQLVAGGSDKTAFIGAGVIAGKKRAREMTMNS